MEGEQWKLGRRPALDGLRGVAVILVVAAHALEGATLWFHGAGAAGVVIFFVLSGFLITCLLLEERDHAGHISLGTFFLNRALRLFPALGAMLFVTWSFGMVTVEALFATMFYASNWYQAATGQVGGLGHTWSLAVEEQFYIIWPLVILATARFRIQALLLVAILGALASIIARFILFNGDPISGFQVTRWTHTRADALLLGCALAAAMHGRTVRRVSVLGVNATMGLTLAVAIAGTPWRFVELPTLVGLLAGASIFFATQAGYQGWLCWPPLVLVGRRSYALYLWHVPVLTFVALLQLSWPVTVLIGVTASGLLTMISWRLIEEPFLRLKRRGTSVDRQARLGQVP